MGRRLVKQDNGLFALFSDVVDALIFYNATAEDIVQFQVDEAAAAARRHAEQWVAGNAPGRKTYTPQEALEWVPEWEYQSDYTAKVNAEQRAVWAKRRDVLQRQLAGEVVEGVEDGTDT